MRATHGFTSWLAAICIAPAMCIATATADRAARAEHATAAAPADHVAVGPIAITVRDLEASCAWYESTLGFHRVAERTIGGESFERLVGVFGARARIARLRLGAEEIELWQFLTPAGRAVPPDTRSNDRWFQHIAIIVRDMDEAYAQLTERGVVEASAGPQRLPEWNRNAAGIEAFYFRDPDGHYLEILEFPSGKGADRWQANDAVFLGIDHTAIVTWDTDAALRFYRDTLGFRVVGESENYGSEQERLNAVFSARVRITTLRTDSGPAVELLEYLTPRDGRPMPLDTRPTDLWHWHITVTGPDADAMFTETRSAGGWPVSPGAQHGSILVRDPDGHAALIEPSAGAETHAHQAQ